ncbi:MAG: hypothetical protein KIT09_15060 [Bryobacteraceae bacterium]|nr:hypothetical protein [Bryobacteraceae bacterium]
MRERLIFIRIVVALMCIAFAHLLGRALAKKQRPARRGLSPTSWSLRTLLAAGALAWPAGVDWLAVSAYALAAVSAGLGFALQRRAPRGEEDLAGRIFRGDE